LDSASEDKKKLEVSVKYGDLAAVFSGSPQEVYKGIVGFFSRVLPTYEIAAGLVVSVEDTELIEKLKGIIGVAPEGVTLMAPRENLTDRDAILLHLTAAYLASRIGRAEKASVSTVALVGLTKGKPGGVAARLSELSDIGWVSRVGKGEYQITTLGLRSLLDVIVPRLRTLVGER